MLATDWFCHFGYLPACLFIPLDSFVSPAAQVNQSRQTNQDFENKITQQ